VAVYSVGTPVNTHSATGSVTGTWGAAQFRVAGHLLVAVVTCGASTSVTATATVSGWVNQFEVPNTATAQVRVAIWTKTAVGSDAVPTFTSTEVGTAGGMDCVLFELSGANTTVPVDVSATFASGAVAGTVTPTATTAALAANGEFALACFAQEAAAAILTWTDTGTGNFGRLLNGNGASSVLQTYVGIVNPPTGTLNDAGAFSTNTTAFGAGIVVAFAASVPAPAINVAFANNAAATVTVGGTTAPAGGTVEAWTVNVSGAFSVASTTAQPPTQFTVCDPALPAEKFLVTVAPGGVGGSQSWTVTRGAEGTTPVSHTAGFTIVNVTTGGFLSGVSKELSAIAYVDCDYTGAVDASAAFNAALAALPRNNGYPVGKIIFGPGNVKMSVTPDNPGSCVYVEGAGNYATTINSFVPAGGDCFRIFDPGQFGTHDTNNGGGISKLTIRGDNAGAGSCGLHAGDLDNYFVDIVVLNFTGAGSKGVWFDNEYTWTELLRGNLLVSGCTTCVLFDNPTTALNSSGSSFARITMTIILEQGLDGTGQVFGDGVVLQNGALIIDADLTITGNFVMSAAATSAAVLRITGVTPAGHNSAGRATGFANSRLHMGVECDAFGANANAPMTIFSDGTGYIQQCYGVLSFGAGTATFVSSNIGGQIKACLFQVFGDNALGAGFQVFMTEQFQAITTGYTLTTATTAQKLLNATANGALAIRANTTFFFEAVFSITGLSASAHTVSFGFGGTATYTSCAWQALTTAGGTGGAAALYSATSNAATAITAAGITTTTLQAVIKGVIRTNAAGTLIPQITNATNGIAAVVAANSYFRLTPVGADSLASAGFGNWT
jgi:hypothetical protein